MDLNVISNSASLCLVFEMLTSSGLILQVSNLYFIFFPFSFRQLFRPPTATSVHNYQGFLRQWRGDLSRYLLPGAAHEWCAPYQHGWHERAHLSDLKGLGRWRLDGHAGQQSISLRHLGWNVGDRRVKGGGVVMVSWCLLAGGSRSMSGAVYFWLFRVFFVGVNFRSCAINSFGLLLPSFSSKTRRTRRVNGFFRRWGNWTATDI